MRTLMRRRLLIWAAIPLLVAQIDCAARGLPPAQSSAPVSERECEEYSKQQKAKSVAGLRVLGVETRAKAIRVKVEQGPPKDVESGDKRDLQTTE